MQIVINIDEDIIQGIIDGRDDAPRSIVRSFQATIADAIKNGTPLPKGHGDLIDRDEVEKLGEGLCATECDCCGLDGCFYDRAEAIIKADRREE